MITVTTGGHTYVGRNGNPPALTLFQRDPVSLKLVSLAMVAALLIGMAELAIRTYQRSTSPGVAAFVAGRCLAVSLFGLIYGLLGIGPVGVLIILSGIPMRSKERFAGA